MKTTKIFAILTLISCVILVSSCGASKSASKQSTPVLSGMKEVALPFSESKYKTDDDFFRAVGLGESSDLATAKKIASLNARTDLAANISSLIKSVNEQYVQQRTVNDRSEYLSKFEELSRNVVSQAISQVKVLDEKAYTAENTNKYSYYVCIEMAKSAIMEEVVSVISEQESIRMDFDKSLFQKTFDEEMSKLINK